jgi:hypothetical protein
MEQYFLNLFFPTWQHLPYVFNTPASLYLRQPHMWTERLRAIHYVGQKPWEPGAPLEPRLAPVFDLWHQFHNELDRFRL